MRLGNVVVVEPAAQLADAPLPYGIWASANCERGNERIGEYRPTSTVRRCGFERQPPPRPAICVTQPLLAMMRVNSAINRFARLWRLNHDLRHTAATDAMRASQHPGAVQGMLGHSTIEQTMRYAHVLDDDVRRAMEKM